MTESVVTLLVLLNVGIASSVPLAGTDSELTEAERIFEANYQAWLEWRQEQAASHESKLDIGAIFDCPSFRQIVDLGLPAVPHIMTKVEQDHHLGYALFRVTKVRWHLIREGSQPEEFAWFVEEWPEIREKGRPPSSRDIWVHWWKEGRFEAPRRFEELYGQWNESKAEGNTEQAEEKLERIKGLGIPALPCVIQAIQQGDRDLVAVASFLTDGSVREDQQPAEVLEWWEENEGEWTLPPDEQPEGEGQKEESDTGE